jgi:hypothetical protein
MPSTYSPLLRVELQAVGENETTWGDITNSNLSTVLENAIAGKADIILNDSNHTLTVRFGQADEARQAMLFVSGTTTAVRDIIVPRATKHYIVRNNTSGGNEIRIKTENGNGVNVANGRAKLVFCDGTNVLDASGGSVDSGVVSPSSLIKEDASWVFEGFVGVNRSNAVDTNFGAFAADGPLGSYSAWYSNGTLVGQLTATSNRFTLSSPAAPVIIGTAGTDRIVVSTTGAVTVNTALTAKSALHVEGITWAKNGFQADGTSIFSNSMFGTFADFSGEVEAGSLRVEASGPTIYMQETNDGSLTRTVHMNAGVIGFTLSGSGWAFYVDDNGNAVATGDITAFSDERLKKDWKALPADFIEEMSEVKLGTYTRTDTGKRQVGVSAQELEGVLPEAVLTDGDGIKSVAYGNAALVLAIELAKTLRVMQRDMSALEARIAELEAK